MTINVKNDYLFRGKRKANGEWVVGKMFMKLPSTIIDNLGYFIRFTEYCIKTDNICYLIVPETLCQYTGLETYSKYDNELHKIFNNDLCYVTEFDREGKDKKHLCKVEAGYYDNIYLVYFVDIYSNWCITSENIRDIESDVELVGNVYDNFELLERNIGND